MDVDPVPPDVQAARTVRMNSEIIRLCSSRPPIWTHPSAKGIGLFTHVAGTKTVPRNPHVCFGDQVDKEVALLPLGGPKRIAPSKTRAPPNEELAAIYKELQDAVRAEEKIFNDMRDAAEERGEAPKDAYRMSLDTLKKKYGDVYNYTGSEASIPSRPKEKRRHSEIPGVTNEEAKKKRRVSFAPVTEPRRQSNDSVSSRGVDADAERRGSGSRPGNAYDASRDPRR